MCDENSFFQTEADAEAPDVSEALAVAEAPVSKAPIVSEAPVSKAPVVSEAPVSKAPIVSEAQVVSEVVPEEHADNPEAPFLNAVPVAPEVVTAVSEAQVVSNGLCLSGAISKAEAVNVPRLAEEERKREADTQAPTPVTTVDAKEGSKCGVRVVPEIETELKTEMKIEMKTEMKIEDGNRDAQLKSEINSEAKVGFNSKEKANVETVKPDTRVAFEIKSEFGQRFMATQKKIGIFGLQNNFGVLAFSLIKHQHDINIWNEPENETLCNILKTQGAKMYAGPQEVAKASDILICSFKNTEEFCEYLANHFVNVLDGKAILDFTIHNDEARFSELPRVVEHCAGRYLHAAILGCESEYALLNLDILADGCERVLHDCTSIFKSICKSAKYFRHPGTARKYAALVKSMRGVMTIAHAEGFALASLVGNPERTNLGELVSYTDNSCRLFEEVLLRKRDLSEVDNYYNTSTYMSTAQDLAEDVQPLTVMKAAHEVYRGGVRSGLGLHDACFVGVFSNRPSTRNRPEGSAGGVGKIRPARRGANNR